jgi:hypothetical protein
LWVRLLYFDERFTLEKMSVNTNEVLESTNRRFWQRREFWAFLLLVLATWVPRVLSLDHFATTDERLWLTRSANFYCALSKQKFANTFQREHPGVMVMWAGTLGYLWEAPEYKDDCLDKITGREDHEEVFEEHGLESIDLLAACRFFGVLGITLALLAAFPYARRLIGFWPAWVGFMILALDPYHIAISRFLHLDGLLSAFMLLSALAFMVYLRECRFRDLAISAVAGGFAWLTKSPALFLILFAGLLTLLRLLETLVRDQGWRELLASVKTRKFWALCWKSAWPLMVWAGIAAVVFFALFPALWVDTGAVLSRMFLKTNEYASVGHGRPIFFDGQIIELGDLGLEFYYFYPLTFLWRTTPMVLLGLLIAVVAFVLKSSIFNDRRVQRFGVALSLFALFFTIAMTLGMKKFDRYLLPVYPMVDLLAGLGLFVAAQWLSAQRWLERTRKYGMALLLGAALVVQTMPVVDTYPYYLTYYNPLMGGSPKALDVMQIGWGEGLDEAARYLNAKPNAEDLWVNTWYYYGCFSYFFEGQGESMSGKYTWPQDQIDRWFFDTDYVVVYVHQWQRRTPELMLKYLATQVPEHSVWIDGIEYARIYKMSSYLDFYDAPTYRTLDVSLGDQIRLEGYNLAQRQFAPGDELRIAFSWEALRKPDERYKVFVHLLDASGKLVAQSDFEPLSGYRPTDAWELGDRTPDHHLLSLPPDLPPGTYTLWAGMYSGASGERLAMTQEGKVLGDSFELGDVEIGVK